MSKELSGQPHVNVTDLVSVPSKKRTSEEDGSGLPSKREWFPSMIQLHFQQWWRLLNSPSNNNESLMLELSGAWEPPDKTRAWRHYLGSSSLSRVLS